MIAQPINLTKNCTTLSCQLPGISLITRLNCLSHSASGKIALLNRVILKFTSNKQISSILLNTSASNFELKFSDCIFFTINAIISRQWVAACYESSYNIQRSINFFSTYLQRDLIWSACFYFKISQILRVINALVTAVRLPTRSMSARIDSSVN